MTQVSNIPLSKDLEMEMHTLLQYVLLDLHTKDELNLFLEDLLTPTEKVMLGKRLAVAFLIDKGYDHRTIRRIMHMSLTTISSVHYWLKNKGVGYRMVIERMKKEKRWKERLNGLNTVMEKVFTLSVPEQIIQYKEYQQQKKKHVLV